MSLVQRDDIIQQLAAATSHPALGHAILPGTLDRRLHTLYLQGSNRRGDFESILCVVTKDEELGREFIRERFAYLLDNPIAGRIPRNIEVQDTSTVMADDEEAVEHVEGEGRDREEIHRRDGFRGDYAGTPASVWWGLDAWVLASSSERWWSPIPRSRA